MKVAENDLDFVNLKTLQKRKRQQIQKIWKEEFVSTLEEENLFVAGLFFVNDRTPLFVKRKKKKDDTIQVVIPGGKANVDCFYDKNFHIALGPMFDYYGYSKELKKFILDREAKLKRQGVRTTIDNFLILEFFEETGLYPSDFVFAYRDEFILRDRDGKEKKVHRLFFWVLAVFQPSLSIQNNELIPINTLNEAKKMKSMDENVVNNRFFVPVGGVASLAHMYYVQPFEEICGVRSMVDKKFKEEYYG